MCVYCNLRLAAVNRHRKRLFGNVPLVVYTTTPADGETEAATFTTDWMAHRVDLTTIGFEEGAGGWQFQVIAAEDWKTSQAFMQKIVAMTVATRRWTVTKIEEPIGHSLIWKVKAETSR